MSVENGTMELNGYSDIRKVGAGGMANVFAATQTSFGRRVAIKVLLPAYASDKEFSQRFLREAQTVSKLSHPHIIPVYDFGQLDGSFYMVMDFLPGGDLVARIKQGMTEDEALLLLANIANALHYAHEKGFVHRDVKPDNIMFRDDNSPVLTDFGIARQQSGENQVTVAGQILGTPKYMSPEQLQGHQLDGRSDIYALGILFFEMLAQKVPYSDDDFIALATMHIQAPIPKLPQKFARFQNFVERMMAKEPAHRYQSAQEVANVAEQIRSGKLDPFSIETSNSAALKQAMEQKENALVAANNLAPVQGVKIAKDLMVVLRETDPILNENWNELISNAFAELKPNERKFVYAQILKPKGILYDSQNKQFMFHGRPTVATVLKEVIQTPALQNIGAKILKIQQTMRATRDVNAFADLVEGCLSAIEKFDAEEALVQQIEKNTLRGAFLDDLVLTVRGAQFDVPTNRRSLTLEGIKAFIIDVFVRHQMIGNRFRTVPVAVLEKDPHDFLRDVVAFEARTRQCDVIRTDDYIYLVGPVRDVRQNPYSIRRFLNEEEAMGGQVVYFNVVPIPLDKIDIPKAQETIAWFISRIVTLERQLSENVQNFIKGLEKTREQYLTPMLKKSLLADGSDIEQTIEERLTDFEKKTAMLILSKLPNSISELAHTLDEFEYMFFNIRRLLIELACDCRDFASQSVATWSVKAEQLDMKMMSYIKLLEKRKEVVFAIAKPAKDDPTQDQSLLYEELIRTLDDGEKEVERLTVKLRDVIRKQEAPKGAIKKLMEKLFGVSEQDQITPEQVQGEISGAHRRCLLTMIRIVKRYPKISIYLELENIMMASEGFRHYGLSAGKSGITRLPTILALPEVAEQLDYEATRQLLKDGMNA